MKYVKHSFQKPIPYLDSTIIVEGSVSADFLQNFHLHEELNSFRAPAEQMKMLQKIASLPEGKVIIAYYGQTIVGYVVFSYPDPREHWSRFKMPDLLELGSIEVSRPFRGNQIAKRLLEVSFLDPTMEDYIVMTTLYYWHWDLKGTGLTIWQYRRIMENVMKSAGLICYPTNDPEIRSHPVNSLMARIGKNVPQSSIEKFDELRFQYR
ncbi:GNAT family N-acetyltransferase [Tepidibacillus fermentans]|uniref:Acetoin utilization protein AcuA n=1 Tax=Tepidibacillus fermentans TaxID=1281767 RepID=A0A4V2UT16_9BACI|nr:GNAT family N-acetyltransferase [Tepidibacillus fermentans]TCS83754.1 acetoin utilization protein AcuA [Tepidibacillus fermentans]